MPWKADRAEPESRNISRRSVVASNVTLDSHFTALAKARRSDDRAAAGATGIRGRGVHVYGHLLDFDSLVARTATKPKPRTGISSASCTCTTGVGRDRRRLRAAIASTIMAQGSMR